MEVVGERTQRRQPDGGGWLAVETNEEGTSKRIEKRKKCAKETLREPVGNNIQYFSHNGLISSKW